MSGTGENDHPPKSWRKRLTVVGIIGLLVAGLASYAKARGAFEGLLALLEDAKPAQFRFTWLGSHRIQSTLQSDTGKPVCIDKITPFPPLGPNKDSALVEWRIKSTEDGDCEGLRHIGVIDGRAWKLRYLANDYRDEDANQFVELHDPWIVTMGENGHLWGIEVRFYKDGELRKIPVPGDAYPSEDMPIQDRPGGGIAIWTLQGLVVGDENSGTLRLVDSKEYAWGNTDHFLTIDYGQKPPIVRDKETLIPMAAGNGTATDPPTFNIYFEAGDRFYILGNCGADGLKRSSNFPGAWVVDPESKDGPEEPSFSCYKGESDDPEDADLIAQIVLKH